MTRRIRIPGRLRPLFTPGVQPTLAQRRDLKSQPAPIIEAILDSFPNGTNGRELLGLRQPERFGIGELLRAAVLPQASRFSDELRWVGLVVAENRTQIATWITVHRQFENAFLLGQFHHAQTILDNAKELGITLWYVGARFLLAETTGGLSANRALLADWLVEASDDPLGAIIKHLLQTISQRSESSISARRFVSETQADALRAAQDDSNVIASWIPFVITPTARPANDKLTTVAWLTELLPPYDTYRFLLSLVKTTVNLGTIRGHTNGRVPGPPQGALLKALRSLPDGAREHALLQALDPGSSFQDPHADAITAVYSNYDRGDYSAAVTGANALLAANPAHVHLHLLSIKAQVYSGTLDPVSPFNDCPARTLYNALKAVALRTSDFQSGVEQLMRLGIALDHSNAALAILGTLSREGVGPATTISSDAFFLAMPSVSPGFATVLAREPRRRFLAHFDRGYLASTRLNTVPVRASPENNVTMLRGARHAARDLEDAEDFAGAIALYRWMLAQHPPRPLYVSTVRSLHRCLTRAGITNDASQLVADHLALADPVFDADTIAATRAAASSTAGPSSAGSLVWPILVYASEYSTVHPDRVAVFDAVDDSLNALDAKRPSDLIERPAIWVDPLDAAKAAYFLGRVCGGDVLDSSHRYAGISALQDERIAICRFLVRPESPADAAIRSDAAAELNAIALARFRRRAARHLRRSRIFVDKAALERTLVVKLAEHFARYRAYAVLDKALRKQLELSGVSLNHAAKVVILDDVSFILFEQLFSLIADHYVSSNEHGLDSYLSVRLRHGTLAAELRNPFETAHLVTKKEKEERYAANAYVLEPLIKDGVLDPSKLAAVDSLSREFSAKIDGIIERVRAQYVRIRSETFPNGLFDYAFSARDLGGVWGATLVAIAQSGTQSDDEVLRTFVRACFGALDERTVSLLGKVRDFVAGQLSDELTQAIDDFRADFVAIDPSLRTGILERNSTGARTSVLTKLRNDVVHWFDEPAGATAEAFSLAQLEVLIGDLCRTQFPTVTLAPSVSGDSTVAMFDGACLLPLVDVFQLLLGNAAQHSALDPVRVELALLLSDKSLSVTVINDVADSVGMSSLLDARNRTAQLLSSRGRKTDLVRKEGGSGYAKLIKLLEYDLRIPDAEAVAIAVTERAGGRPARFSVTVRMPVGALRTRGVVESPSHASPEEEDAT